MSISKRIALVFDCDGTISEDTTTRLLEHLGAPAKAFWIKATEREKDGWEPTMAFMHLLIEQSKQTPITADVFRTVGKIVKLSPGIPQFLFDMKQFVRQNWGERGVSLHVFVVSGGIEEIIRATPLSQTSGNEVAVDDFFGCRFAYAASGEIAFPKCAITFTEKTKILFAINKGISSATLASNAYAVNDHVPLGDRDVMLENMIYIGDGPTDVAAMSLLKANNAEVFAVYTAPRWGIPKRTYALARQGRFTRGPFNRDYSDGSDLRRALVSELEGYAQRIITEAAAARLRAPRHD